jgi:hypothetical protein
MEWFSQNWVWVLFFIAFIAMHMFGHGGHGGHGGSHNKSTPESKDGAQTASKIGSGHKH